MVQSNQTVIGWIDGQMDGQTGGWTDAPHIGLGVQHGKTHIRQQPQTAL